MAKTVADVIKMVKDNEVKFVDFRFTDTRGKEQHVSVPVSAFNEEKFTEGHAFDGSSIAGWKGIEASDMLLMPDAMSAFIDPFFQESTLVLSCDVLEPGDGKSYDRDPRSIAKRAEAYLKASGFGDTAYFGPEPEFFIFDDVRWANDMSGAFFKIDEYEAPWNSDKVMEGGNKGHRPTVKGGYFPVPPVDSMQDNAKLKFFKPTSLGETDGQDRRRRHEGREGQRNQVCRLPIYRYPWQRTARQRAYFCVQRRKILRRPCV